MKKNQQIVLLLVLMIASSDLLICSNALRLQPSLSTHPKFLHNTNKPEVHEVLLETLAETNDQLAAGPGTNAQILTQAGNAITGVKNVADALKNMMEATSSAFKKLSNVVNKLAALGGAFAALGGAFAVFDLIFSIGAKTDLEKITERIDDAERRIRQDIEDAVETLTLAARKSAFYDAESKIKSAAGHLKNMTESKGKNQADFKYYKKQFLADAKKTEDYIQIIYDAYQPSWSNGDPIFEQIMKTYDGDWTKVADALETMTLWLLQAQINYVAYLGLTGDKDLVPSFIKDFQQKMQSITTYAATLPEKNFKVASQYITDTLQNNVKDICGDGNGLDKNKACANAILDLYKNKYPNYLIFTVIVFNDYSLTDTDKSFIDCQNCAVRQTSNKNTVIFWALDKACEQFSDPFLTYRLDTYDLSTAFVPSPFIKQQFYAHWVTSPTSATTYKIDSTYMTGGDTKIFKEKWRFNWAFDAAWLDNPGSCFWQSGISH